MLPHTALDVIVLSEGNQKLQENEGPETGNGQRLSGFRLPGRLYGCRQLTLNPMKVTAV